MYVYVFLFPSFQSLLALIFFASLRQLIQESKDKLNSNRQGDTQLLTATQQNEGIVM